MRYITNITAGGTLNYQETTKGKSDNFRVSLSQHVVNILLPGDFKA
jgi:hypothetical protein